MYPRFTYPKTTSEHQEWQSDSYQNREEQLDKWTEVSLWVRVAVGQNQAELLSRMRSISKNLGDFYSLHQSLLIFRRHVELREDPGNEVCNWALFPSFNCLLWRHHLFSQIISLFVQFTFAIFPLVEFHFNISAFVSPFPSFTAPLNVSNLLCLMPEDVTRQGIASRKKGLTKSVCPSLFLNFSPPRPSKTVP